jgi:hypothetical protein
MQQPYQNSAPLMSIPTFQLLQQPTEAQRFTNNWQSPTTQGASTTSPPSTFESTRPLNLGGNAITNNFRPNPLPSSFQSTSYPTNPNLVGYQSSYVPSMTFSSVPPVVGNYPPPTFSSRPLSYDYTGAKPPGSS